MKFPAKFNSQNLLLNLTASVLLVLAVPILFFSEALSRNLDQWTTAVLAVFGNFYLYLGFGAVLLMLILAIHPIGKIKLGAEKPEFGWWSWIAMLYSTGMGGGLVLRAVQEPVFYFQNPPRETSFSPEVFALEYTFFHWGFTPWAFYGLMAVIISATIYLKNRTALSSSSLSGHWLRPWLASLVDLLTILCTLFGVVAGVGLGSRQLLGAISFGLGSPIANKWTVIPILLVCIIATLSAYFGVRRGIKLISNINIFGASLLLIFAWLVGNSWDSLVLLGESLGHYLVDFVPMSVNAGFTKVESAFLKDWTYFYWAFWLSWAPFTGVFIARISKGRSIRELVLGTLLVPALGTFVWFSVFGTNGMQLIKLGQAESDLFSSIYTSIFHYFSFFPMDQAINWGVGFLVMTFLITSIDSAIFVLSIFTDGGKTEPRLRIRIFWGISIFFFTAGLIWIGKEELLGTISNLLILFALPFSLVFVLLIIHFLTNLFKPLKNE